MICIRVAGELFRRDVRRRADRGAGRRQCRRPLRAGHGLGDPEIREHRGRAGEEDVLGLQVAMHHAVRVRVLERVEDAAEHTDRGADGETPFVLEPAAERLAAHVRHHIEGDLPPVPRLDGAYVQERNDRRMLQPRRLQHFISEALDQRLVHQVRRQHLDHHFALELGVLREEDSRHAAASQFTDDPELLADGGLQACAEIWKWAPLGEAGQRYGRVSRLPRRAPAGRIGSFCPCARWRAIISFALNSNANRCTR
jgi:hypothetical protein